MMTPELLEAADLQQKAWREALNHPFARLSPQQRVRGRAAVAVTDETLSAEERALAWATLGRFDEAVELCPQDSAHREHLEASLEALERDDGEWCEHPEAAQFVEQDLYSIRHRSDAYLLRCNACGFRNLVPALPEHIEIARRKRQQARAEQSGLMTAEVKRRFGDRRG